MVAQASLVVPVFLTGALFASLVASVSLVVPVFLIGVLASMVAQASLVVPLTGSWVVCLVQPWAYREPSLVLVIDFDLRGQFWLVQVLILKSHLRLFRHFLAKPPSRPLALWEQCP